MCFGFKKTNREISTAGGKVISLVLIVLAYQKIV